MDNVIDSLLKKGYSHETAEKWAYLFYYMSLRFNDNEISFNVYGEHFKHVKTFIQNDVKLEDRPIIIFATVEIFKSVPFFKDEVFQKYVALRDEVIKSSRDELVTKYINLFTDLNSKKVKDARTIIDTQFRQQEIVMRRALYDEILTLDYFCPMLNLYESIIEPVVKENKD